MKSHGYKFFINKQRSLLLKDFNASRGSTLFLTSFQFINLSNLALWVNNRHKWITVIFLNLCDNFLYYMICFFLLSLVFAFVLSPYFRHWPNPTTNTINLFCTINKNFSQLYLFFFFFFFSIKHYTNIFSNIYRLYSLSLFLSFIYIIQESHKHRVIESPKSQKKKKNHK